MRMWTFADESLVDLLNQRFIPVWNNHNPQGREIDARASYPESEMKSVAPGGGAGFLRCYVATPDGIVLSQLQGYWPAAILADEARFALDLTPANAKAKHQERIDALPDSPHVTLLFRCHQRSISESPSQIADQLRRAFMESRCRFEGC